MRSSPGAPPPPSSDPSLVLLVLATLAVALVLAMVGRAVDDGASSRGVLVPVFREIAPVDTSDTGADY